jgi:hypothetical protein
MKTASATMRSFFMSYVRGEDRGQAALLPAAIEEYGGGGCAGSGERRICGLDVGMVFTTRP